MQYNEFVSMVCDSLGIEITTVNDNTSFLYDLGVDSLSLANFIIKLEHRYGIRIEMNNVWELRTMREAYDKFSAALQLKKEGI